MTTQERLAPFSARQIARYLAYERQFAGIPAAYYSREECQNLASELRRRREA